MMGKGFQSREGAIDQIFTLIQIDKKEQEKNVVYMGFMDWEREYDRVNREALWQVLKMYDKGGKLLNRIKSRYVNSLAYNRVK